jgi:signal transduction histidine kinase
MLKGCRGQLERKHKWPLKFELHMSSHSVTSSVEISAQAPSRRATSPRSLRLVVLSFIRRLRLGGYSLAIFSVVLAFLLRLLVDPWLGDQSPYLLFVVAVAVTGLYAGVRPALLAAGLGTVVAYFSFVPPRYQWGFAGPSDAVGFGVYVLGVASVILLTHARIRAAQNAEQHRVQAEEILLKTERLSAAGQMASLLSHEINNPLAALTNVMFLLNQQPLSAPLRELLSAGTDALHRVNRIAGMTMGFFFEKDAPGNVRIRDIVDDVAETLTSAERFRNIQCSRDFRADPNIVASRPRMKQLIASLLTNAMESGARTVRIRVNAGAEWRSPRRNGVRITIADDGCGIPRELREKIFEPFVSSKSQKGTGLGLWASRAIALRNDGKIKMRSAVAGPRKGTCVSVFLPTTAAET